MNRWSDGPGPSTPPETPDALRRRYNPRRESLLPPRNVPSASVGTSLALAAATAAFGIAEPERRALVILACAFLAWLVGYFTPPPRRDFRREDR